MRETAKQHGIQLKQATETREDIINGDKQWTNLIVKKTVGESAAAYSSAPAGGENWLTKEGLDYMYCDCPPIFI